MSLFTALSRFNDPSNRESVKHEIHGLVQKLDSAPPEKLDKKIHSIFKNSELIKGLHFEDGTSFDSLYKPLYSLFNLAYNTVDLNPQVRLAEKAIEKLGIHFFTKSFTDKAGAKEFQVHLRWQ